MKVIAQQGDTVDALCWRHHGSSAAVEQVLEINPGLAALGPILPHGTPVTLPDTDPAPAGTNYLNLWD